MLQCRKCRCVYKITKPGALFEEGDILSIQLLLFQLLRSNEYFFCSPLDTLTLPLLMLQIRGESRQNSESYLIFGPVGGQMDEHGREGSLETTTMLSE